MAIPYQDPFEKFTQQVGGEYGPIAQQAKTHESLLNLAMMSKRIQMEHEAQKAQAQFASQLRAVPTAQMKAGLGVLGATPEQTEAIAQTGPMQPETYDTIAKSLGAMSAHKLQAQTTPQEVRDADGLLVRTNHVNAFGTPVKIENNPSYTKDRQSLSELRDFKLASDQAYDLYTKVRNQPAGAGFGRGMLKGLEAKVGLNPEADTLNTLGAQVMGQFSRQMENIPGGRFSISLAKMGKTTPFTAGTNPQTADNLHKLYQDVYRERLNNIYSSSGATSGSPGQRPVPSNLGVTPGQINPQEQPSNDPLGLGL